MILILIILPSRSLSPSLSSAAPQSHQSPASPLLLLRFFPYPLTPLRPQRLQQDSVSHFPSLEGVSSWSNSFPPPRPGAAEGRGKEQMHAPSCLFLTWGRRGEWSQAKGKRLCRLPARLNLTRGLELLTSPPDRLHNSSKTLPLVIKIGQVGDTVYGTIQL